MSHKTFYFLLGVLFFNTTIADERTAEEIHLEALKIDAEAVAKSYQIPYQDALRQLKLQNASNEITSKLREEFLERLAGIYIEHDPIDRLVVRLKGDKVIPDRELNFDGDVLLIQFISGQNYTKNELKKKNDGALFGVKIFH